jgi:phosphohistidine swiveling domain-containing protein
MKRDKQFIKDNLKDLQSFTYYQQRFDACPHFMFFLGDAHASRHLHSKYPIGQRITAAYFNENKADWLHPFLELKYTAVEINKLLKQKPQLADEMIAEFQNYEDEFYKLCHDIDAKDLAKLSDQELVGVYNNLGEVYANKLIPSPLIDGYALSTDIVISQDIEDHLEARNRLKEFVKIFEILTAPTFLSFLQLEELDLLKMILFLKKEKNKTEEYLLNHQKKYFWIDNNYVKDKILDLVYFKNRIKEFSKINIEERINEIEELPARNIKIKQALIKELELPEQLVIQLELTDRFSYWQDERKKGTFWATHYFSLLLEEISKRTKYSLIELKYAFPSEMSDIVEDKFSVDILRKRFKGCLLVWTFDKYDVSTDKKVIDSIMSGEKEKIIDKEIRGMTVSLGKATGKVKIIKSAKEIDKVAEGDILVAVMTRPDYVPAMKRAAAVVTNEGGITCHAAIISRELKIPCIIGTKIATKVLKDGMEVEVNANHGVLKIIK